MIFQSREVEVEVLSKLGLQVLLNFEKSLKMKKIRVQLF